MAGARKPLSFNGTRAPVPGSRLRVLFLLLRLLHLQECDNHEAEEHFFCRPCDRKFQNSNNIKQHLNSRIHRGTNIKCPFCGNQYATATGMVHRLEGGSCSVASGLNRDEVYRIVRSKDPSGIISKKLIGWTGDQADSGGYEATDRAWNGDQWECYFCHREFGSRHALSQHLNSPVHRHNMYHCPKPYCRMDFKTLAAIINRLESESCGAMRFEAVQRRIGDIVSGNRLIAF
ncbi:hypothetical protein B0H66DRAFT_76166 [Apodospora peruviana]|uniref:C2H2-type domain-containing protein n=1 Tax=Apodospora peruviana TaxID=516989 RepID=A0AAE0ITD2_9PEZI|nr:hypothetical protein B0H66DRAFT_76166 [Apodospora peruviana]